MKVAHFYCYGCIGENDPLFKVFTGEDDPAISSQKVVDFLASLASDVTNIVVHINSRGGNVDEGFAIHDLFKNSGKKVKTLIEGQCASIATVILFCGSEREATPNSSGLIHNPWIDPYSIDGMTADDLQNMSEMVRREETRLLDFYVANTGADRATLAEYMKVETKFSPEQLLELKFINKIAEPVKAFAYHKSKTIIKNDTEMSDKKNKFLQFLAETKTKIHEIFGEETPAVKAESASTSDGTVMYFEGTLAEGTMVFSDEAMTTATPDGSYTMPDESTVEVAGGAVTSITAKASAAVTPEDEIKALKEENEKLKADLNAKTSELTSVETESTKVVSDLTARLTKIKSVYVPKTSTTQFQSKETATTKEQMQKEVEEKKAKMEELLSKK